MRSEPQLKPAELGREMGVLEADETIDLTTRRWIAEQLGKLAAQADADLRAKIQALQAALLAA